MCLVGIWVLVPSVTRWLDERPSGEPEHRVLHSHFAGRRGNLQGSRDGWRTRYPDDRVSHRNHMEQQSPATLNNFNL